MTRNINKDKNPKHDYGQSFAEYCEVVAGGNLTYLGVFWWGGGALCINYP